jgi:hypothetical protein
MGLKSVTKDSVAFVVLCGCAWPAGVGQTNPQPASKKLLGSIKASQAVPARQSSQPKTGENGATNVTAHPHSLHGYIGFGHEKLPAGSAYTAGMGFYAAVWPLLD